MIGRLHHVGIAVEDLNQATSLYEGLGARRGPSGRQERESIDWALLHVGAEELELMHSSDPESPVGRFLERRGPGVHHVAYEVADLDAALDQARARGLEPAGEVRVGVHGTRVAFLHPKSMGGVLTELVEAG